MTFEEWISRRRRYEHLEEAEMDLKENELPEGVEGPGFVYPGALVIEGPLEDGRFVLTIANECYDGPLDYLEPILYEWASSEGYWT